MSYGSQMSLQIWTIATVSVPALADQLSNTMG
jgi:hypothetical protein